jgi:integrase/recombinase XerC
MRLSALFEEFCHYLRVEQEATPRTIQTYRWCFGHFEAFVMQQVGGTVLLSHFTVEHCRRYQYDQASRGRKTNTIHVRLATLSSFGTWAVRRDKLVRNPVDALTRPRKKARLPHVPRWETIERLLQPSNSPRERALVALMALGGLRRSECVALDVGDVVSDFGLRRVLGKGGHEASMPLPAPARAILVEYLRTARAGAAPTEPLFVVTFPTKGGKRSSRRMSGQRVWEIVKDLGRRVGVPELHPHALRHACGAEFLRRTHGNLRIVQEHLRHRDVQTTTVYTKITQEDLQQQLRVFDNEGESKKDSRPSPQGI